MNPFPFPDKKVAGEELKQDILYHKIPKQDLEGLCDMAWERGAGMAEEIHKKYPSRKIVEIARQEGVRIIRLPEEEINNLFRTFGEYNATSNEIILYMGSIVKWARANDISAEIANDLVTAHEFYHFLECTQSSETANLYKVPIWKIGKVVLRQSGIRALSEISAHGFARTYLERHGF